jgi:glycerate-2-kinase
MTKQQSTQELVESLGPGLITGAADDDSSGSATYSQAGAQFRFGLVVTRHNRTPLQPPSVIARIEIVEAAHPVPDAAGMASA